MEKILPELDQPIVLRIDNGKADHSYIRLFDPGFSKQQVIINVPEMDTPQESGHLVPYATILRRKAETSRKIGSIYIWNPQLHMHLDLFTLHYYQSDPEQVLDVAPVFSNLRVLYPRLDPFQMQPALLIDLENPYIFDAHTQVSFIVPAMTKTVIHFYPVKK